MIPSSAASQRCLLSWAKHTYTPLRYKQSFNNSFVHSFMHLNFVYLHLKCVLTIIWPGIFNILGINLFYSNSLAFFSSVSTLMLPSFANVYQFLVLRILQDDTKNQLTILARLWVVRKKDWFVPWKLDVLGDLVCWGGGCFTGDRRKHAPADNYKLLVYPILFLLGVIVSYRYIPGGAVSANI